MDPILQEFEILLLFFPISIIKPSADIGRYDVVSSIEVICMSYKYKGVFTIEKKNKYT